MTWNEAIKIVSQKQNQGKMLMRWATMYSPGQAWGFDHGRWSDFSYYDDYYLKSKVDDPKEARNWKIEPAPLFSMWLGSEYVIVTREELKAEIDGN